MVVDVTGGNGVYERRHELPEARHTIGKHRRAEWVGTLLEREELVMAMAQGSKLVKWLDVPDGPVASGQAMFVTGHLGCSGAGGPMGNQRSRARVETVRLQGRRAVPSFPEASL